MPNRTVGKHYDAEKFDNLINGAAFDLVKSTMGDDADTDKGREFARQAAENLRASFSALSVSYYQALDAFADGKDIGEYLKPEGDSGATLEGSFIDVVLACGDGKLLVKNEQSAVKYYDRLFPEARHELTDEDIRGDIPEAERGAEQTHGRPDRGVSAAEALENFNLRRAAAALEKANMRVSLWSNANQTRLTENENSPAYKELLAARQELDGRQQRLEALKEKAIASARERLDKGKITAEQFDRRKAMIEGYDVRSYDSEELDTTAEAVDIAESEEAAPDSAPPKVSEAEHVKRYRVDFNERHIELGKFVPQVPISSSKEREADADEINKATD